MGPSVPLSVGKAVAWFENLASFDQSQWMSADPFVQTVIKDLLRRLEEGAPPRKRAPRMLSAFIPALEGIVVRRGADPHLRAGAWMKLVEDMGLRFDDMAHMRRDMVKSYEGKLASEPRQRVQERESRSFWVSQPGIAADALMARQEAVSWSSEVCWMPRGMGKVLVRTFGEINLAALGVSRPDRDMLWRWTPKKGSDTYVRSYKAVVKRLQLQFAQPVREGRSYDAFDEGAVLEELKEWLVTKWQVATDVAEDAVEQWKVKVKPQGTFMDMVSEGEGRKERGKPQQRPATESSSSSTSSLSSEEESQVKKRKVERLEEEREGGYVIVYNRIERGKLHRGGALKGAGWQSREGSRGPQPLKRCLIQPSTQPGANCAGSQREMQHARRPTRRWFDTAKGMKTCPVLSHLARTEEGSHPGEVGWTPHPVDPVEPAAKGLG
eukprot:s708_g26.t1